MSSEPSVTVSGLVREVLNIQSKRAQLYAQMNEGFKTFLGDMQRREGTYQQIVASTSASFNDCSRRVIAIEAQLKEMGRADLSMILRQIQTNEQKKLELTVTQQVLRRSEAANEWSWQRSDAETEPAGPGPAAPAHTGPTENGHTHAEGEEANGHTHTHTPGAGCCSCGHGHEEEEAPEPTEEEFRNAISELTTSLDGVVNGLLDSMEELRYALAELEGEDA